MKARMIIVVSGLFLLATGAAVAAKRPVDPPAYRGKAAADAGKVLLDRALVQADKGSWERIAVGRIYYLGGMKPEGEAIFAPLSSVDADSSDIYRIARVYREAGEWPRAKALFDRALAMEPKEEKWLAEVGAYYLLNGDRAGAEALFDRSFRQGDELWATVAAAGAYLDVVPQE